MPQKRCNDIIRIIIVSELINYFTINIIGNRFQMLLLVINLGSFANISLGNNINVIGNIQSKLIILIF